MKRLQKIFLLLGITAAGVALLLCRSAVTAAVSNALTLCGRVLIPSLFPFMALSAFALRADAFHAAERLLSPLMQKCFRLPGRCFSAVFFGFIGGYPVGANMIAELYEAGEITQNEAKRLFSFCVNAGPAFVVSAAGGMMLGSEKAGTVMLLAIFCSSSAVGLLSSLFAEKKTQARFSVRRTPQDVGSALTQSVASAMSGILSVCAWVILFSVITGIARPFIKNETASLLFDTFSEVTAGVPAAYTLGGVPLTAAAISFGGVCILCQLFPLMKKCGVKVSEYLGCRMVNSVLTYFVTKLLLRFVEIPVSVSSSVSAALWSNSAPAAAALLLMGSALILEINRNLPIREGELSRL